MLLEFVWCVPLHPASPGQTHDCEHLAARLRRLNTAYWQDEKRKAATQDQATGEYASGAILDEDTDGTLGSCAPSGACANRR